MSGNGSEQPIAWSDDRMYAIAFDLDTAACEEHYPAGHHWRNAYGDIQRVLEEFEFWGQQGSVYYSNHKRAMKVWQAVNALKSRLPWFPLVVRDLRMLRIEENNDLLPLLGQPELPLGKPHQKRRTPDTSPFELH